MTEIDHLADRDTQLVAGSRSRLPIIQRWERFWFENVPSEVFAFVRIAVGAAGFVSLIGATPVEMFWSPDGIAPLPGGGLNFRGYILDSGLGVVSGWTLFLVLFVSFIFMTAGLFTSAAMVTTQATRTSSERGRVTERGRGWRYLMDTDLGRCIGSGGRRR